MGKEVYEWTTKVSYGQTAKREAGTFAVFDVTFNIYS